MPWAALGEARQTFKTGPTPGIAPPRCVRRFDATSFALGVVNAAVGGIFALLGHHKKIVDLASFNSTLATGREVLTFGMIAGTVAGIVFLVYALDFLRLYRVALARTVTDVFDESPGVRLAMPPGPSAQPLPGLPGT